MKYKMVSQLKGNVWFEEKKRVNFLLLHISQSFGFYFERHIDYIAINE